MTDWEVFNWITLISFVGALLWIAWRYASWSFQDYIVTNRRVMQVEGIINKVSSDSSLEKINDAVLKQGLLGRLLHFGDLDILTASENTVDQFRMLNDAATSRRRCSTPSTPSSGRSRPPCPARPCAFRPSGRPVSWPANRLPRPRPRAAAGDAAMTRRR